MNGPAPASGFKGQARVVIGSRNGTPTGAADSIVQPTRRISSSLPPW